MMSNPRAAHPLDVDLVDFVDGSLDAAEARIVEEHLSSCPSCRIKRRRISQTPPIVVSDLRDYEVPQFERLDVEDVNPAAAKVGELWLTATDDSVMVLITKVRPNGWGVVVVPVVFDVEVADSGSLVLDETASPLRVPISVYEGMLTSLPASALKGRVIPIRKGIDLLKVTDTDPGVSRGTALEGSGDSRHEIRHYINERITSADPSKEEPAEEPSPNRLVRVHETLDQATVDAQFRELQAAFFNRADTSVEPLARRLPDFAPTGWEGIAEVRTFNQRVLLLDIEGGLPLDRGPARALCEHFGGTALAVRRHRDSPLADVYSRRELWLGHSVQTGAGFTEPVFSGPVATAVSSYLDTMVNSAIELHSPTTRSSSVDPEAILLGQVARALQTQVATGKNAQIEPKRIGLMSVEGIDAALIEVLRLALTERLTPAELIELADRLTL